MKLDGYYGSHWTDWQECPPLSYVAGFRLRHNLKADIGDLFYTMSDAITEIEIKCKDRSGKETGYSFQSILLEFSF